MQIVRAAQHHEVMAMVAKPKPTKEPKVKKRKVKSERQKLEIRLDALVKEIVLLRDGKCVCPSPTKGHTEVRTPGHLISRGKESVKWDLMNVHEQCSGCNARHEHYPEIFTDWFLRRFGNVNYEMLVARSYKIAKLTIDELETIEMELTEIHKAQQADSSYKPYHWQRDILQGRWSK